MSVDKKILSAYEENGFAVIPDLFSFAEIQVLAKAFDSLEKAAEKISSPQLVKGAYFYVERDRIDRVCWCGAYAPTLMQAGREARMLEVVQAILKTDSCDHLINQVHFKRPGDGVSFPWHQDSQHRRYGTKHWTDVDKQGSFVQILLAIDAADQENGCLYAFPGSHKLGHLGIDDQPIESFGFDPQKAEPLILNPGDIVFFGPYLIHGSFKNNSVRPRRALVNGYSAPGANHREYPGVGAGERISLLAMSN